jgi:hypothetical protein
MATLDKLMEGKGPGEIKVRKSSYGEDGYFIPYFRSIYDTWHGLRDDETNDYYDANYDCWELYTEPKPKVRRAQYLMQNLIADRRPFQTYEFFRDDAEAAAAFGSLVMVIGRVVETEREFDE